MALGAKRASALLACAAGALALLLGGASAQPRSVSQAERDRAAADAQAQRLRTQATRTRREIDALDRRLVEAARRRAEAEAAAADSERRLAALRLRQQTDGARYRADRDSLEAALIAAAFAERRVEPNDVHSGMMAAAIAPVLSTRLQSTAASLDEAERLDLAIAEEQGIIMRAQAAIDAERADVVSLLVQRRSVQATLLIDAANAERRAARFAAEARTLRELAQRLQAQRANTERRPVSPQAAVVPASWLAPAEGHVVRPYGTRIAGGPALQGAGVQTRAGAQVVAPAAGEIAYAGPFRGYGNVVILNVAGGYALVLTGLETVRVRVGETAIAGQPVGEMPNSGASAPELYVEVRRDGRPVDPARWLSARGLASGQSDERAG